MPQRTNDFQELVALIQRSLAVQDAKITTSALVNVAGFKVPREIDVLIENPIGSYHMKVAVEAKDNGRKMDQTPFESLLGKYFVKGGLKVDKLVVVNRAGFYKPVVDRANMLDVQLFTLTEAKAADWLELGHPYFNVDVFLDLSRFSITPHIPGFDPAVVESEGMIACCHGRKFGRVREVAISHVVSEILTRKSKELRDCANAASTGCGKSTCELSFVPDHEHKIFIRGVGHILEKLSFIADFANAKPLQRQMGFRLKSAPRIWSIWTTPYITKLSYSDLLKHGWLINSNFGPQERVSRIVKHCARFLLSSSQAKAKFNAALEDPENGEAWLEFQIPFKTATTLRLHSVDHSINGISVFVHAVSARARFNCRHLELTDAEGSARAFSRFEAQAAGKIVTMLAPHLETGEKGKIVFDIRDSPDK